MLTLQLTKTVTEEKTIPVPCFWKSNEAYYALIDKDNLYVACCYDKLHSVTNYVPNDSPERVGTYFSHDMELTTEGQFFSAYDEARKATELQPVLSNSDRYVDMLETVGINQKEI